MCHLSAGYSLLINKQVLETTLASMGLSCSKPTFTGSFTGFQLWSGMMAWHLKQQHTPHSAELALTLTTTFQGKMCMLQVT
jgi:hypothetical protein